MNFVDDNETDIEYVRTSTPSARDAIPLLRRGDDDGRLAQGMQVRMHVACELHHAPSETMLDAFTPIVDAFAHQRFQWRDVNALPK